MKPVCNTHLLLVNRQWPLSNTLKPNKLVLTAKGEEDIMLEKQAAVDLTKLLEAINANGQIVQVSGYRDFATQAALYDESIVTHGQTFTDSYVALPGASEHQTGLAIDVGIKKEAVDYLRPTFSGSEMSQRFNEKASQFGFILRYPKRKRGITKIAYEPWHFRYVGYPHSQIISENNWVLEEYIAEIGDHSCYEHAFRWQNYRIVTLEESSLFSFYEKLGEGEEVISLSRNNCGKIVVTFCIKSERSLRDD